MQMLANLGLVSHSGYYIVGYVFGVAGCKAYALDTVNLAYHPQKVGKARFIRVYILPQKHYLANTVCRQSLYFC
jgi:hypothetical protein